MKYSTARSLFLITRDSVLNVFDSVRFSGRERVCYHVETADWSIEKDGRYVTDNLRTNHSLPAGISYSPLGVFGQVLHFGSIHLADRLPDPLFAAISRANTVVVTFYHLEPDDDRVDTLRARSDHVDIVHTSCSITKERLVASGIPEPMVRVVPIGVDTEAFQPCGDATISRLRRELDISTEATVIGSFQKDSHGWGDSTEPKLVKGPDILVDVARRLNETADVLFLLLGPARGYVKQEFEKYDIPYRHVYLEDYEHIPPYYSLLDVYLITSRSEGGPKAIPEGLSTGTPLVTTRVGMAPDVITSGQEGFVVDVEDTEALVKRTRELIEDPQLRAEFARNGRVAVQNLSWESVTERLYQEVYNI